MIGTRRVRRRSDVRPPFLSHPLFEQDFAFVWERKPVCCYCRRPLRAGDYAGWLRPLRLETLHHVACRKRGAAGGTAR